MRQGGKGKRQTERTSAVLGPDFIIAVPVGRHILVERPQSGPEDKRAVEQVGAYGSMLDEAQILIVHE